LLGNNARILNSSKEAGSRNAVDGSFRFRQSFVQSKPGVISTSSESMGKRTAHRHRNGRKETIPGGKSKAQLGSTWYSERTWRENQRNQASEKLAMR